MHKHSLSAVAVDEVERTLAEHSGPVDEQAVASAVGAAQRSWRVSLTDDRSA